MTVATSDEKMFDGEKTFVFWIGLIIVAFASIALFAIIWFNIVIALRTYQYAMGPSLEFQVPFIVAAIVFMLVGLYMVKSGVKKEVNKEIRLLQQ